MQSRAARKRRTMLSRLYTRAAWTARPLTATSHHRVALMSSSSASGKINGEWKGLRLRVAVGFVDREGRSVAISCVNPRAYPKGRVADSLLWLVKSASGSILVLRPVLE